ncbi:hypothetical protein VNO80_21989 [Phaseolus coccineus]|uniref:Uncharacterized protein n=1 Tax=Phaseolus coccineus TaxID=3886 RepID=A0AAN9M497_PHACN
MPSHTPFYFSRFSLKSCNTPNCFLQKVNMGSLLHNILLHQDIVCYHQEWCAYQLMNLFEGDDDDKDDGDYDYAPAA